MAERVWIDAFESKSKSAFHNLRFAILVGALLFALSFSADAQQLAKVPPDRSPNFWLPFRSIGPHRGIPAGSARVGYVEAKNIVIEWRFGGGTSERVPALAAELVRLKVDVIVTGGSTNTRAAKEATVTIPIVMAQDPDPVANGFVASLARPGGNITGLSNLGPEISGKRLELLKEVVPKLSRVAVFGQSTFPGNAQLLREVELAAGALAVKLQYLDVLAGC